MNTVKNSCTFKVISIFLVFSFIALDISWANPISPSERSNLSPQSVFQQNMMTGDGILRQNAVFSDMKFRAFIQSVGSAIFEQKLRLKYLEATLMAELAKLSIDGLDLSKVMIRDEVAYVPLTKDGNRYVIQIALKDSPAAKTLKGYEWAPLDGVNDSDAIYIIKVIPEVDSASGTKSFPAGSGAINSLDVDIAGMVKVLGIGESVIRGSINRVMLLNDFAESVGIKKDAALENMKAADIIDEAVENYNLTGNIFSRQHLEDFRKIQADSSANPKLVDLSLLRIERIILNSINVDGLMESLALAAGKKSEEVAEILKNEHILPTLVATWYLTHPERLSMGVSPNNSELLTSEDLVLSQAGKFYNKAGIKIEFRVPDDSIVNSQSLLALQNYQSVVGANMARGEYNYRGSGTRQTVSQFFNEYFMNGVRGKSPDGADVIYGAWYGKIHEFVEQAFGPKGESMKAIVTNGIGANDQFMWSLIKMYNENKPSHAPVWYHAATAREFARLHSEGKIAPESTIFVDISRSGTTWEGLEVASRSLAEGYNIRIAIVNGGPSKDIAIAAAQQRSRVTGQNIEPLVIDMSPDIGGRNMHRKTSIYYAVQTIAGMFLPSMDSTVFAGLNDRFDQANDFAKIDESLPVSAGRFLQGTMNLLGAQHIVFITNTESLKWAGTEWEEFIMEGSNKKDVISMGIHNLADRTNEPSSILETLADRNNHASSKCVSMALLDESAPSYSEDLERVNKIAEVMPIMIFTIKGNNIKDAEGRVIDTGMTAEQQAAFDMLWTDMVTVFTTLLRVDANSNPNVKKVREYTAERVAKWTEAVAAYAVDPIGTKETELLVSYGSPVSPDIGVPAKQESINTVADAARLGAKIAGEIAQQISAQVKDQARRNISERLRGRDRLNIFVGSEDLEAFAKELRMDAYESQLGKVGWITQTAVFPLWSHKGLEGNLANQAEAKTEEPLLGDKTVNIFVNARQLKESEIYSRGFNNTIDLDVQAQEQMESQWKQLVKPLVDKKTGQIIGTVEGANVHQTNDAMTMPNIKRMAEVSPTVLFECNQADDNVKKLIRAFLASFRDTLAQLSPAEQTVKVQPALAAFPAGQDIFSLNAGVLKQMARNFRADVEARGTAQSSLSDIVTELGIPTGSEKGSYLFIDLGGTKLRVGRVEFNGDRTLKKNDEDELSVTVPKDIVEGGGETLFEFLAKTVKSFTEERKLSGEIKIGFTFSFAMKKEGVDRGIITPECNVKGYNFDKVIGREIVTLLNQELSKIKLDNVRITALVNDTEGVRDTGAYMNEKTIAGGVFGTGHNTAIRNADGRSVNLESGAFYKFAADDENPEVSELDREIDRLSSNPGIHPLEKRLSGKYVGPLFGLRLEREMRGGRLFVDHKTDLPKIFTDHDYEKEAYKGFLGRHLSEIEDLWQPGGVNALKNYIKETLEIRNPTDEDARRLRGIAHDIMLRSAQLGGATFAGIVMQREQTEAPVGEYAYAIEGSLLNYPGYKEMMKAALVDIFGKEYASKLEVFEAKDGAGIGAAITAMIVSTQPGTKSFPAGVDKVSKDTAGTAPSIFDILELYVNNDRTDSVNSANMLMETVAKFAGDKVKDVSPIDKFSATAEIKAGIERAIAAVESVEKKSVSGEDAARIVQLKSRMNQLEADGVVASIITLARKAKFDGQKLIIGLDTDWIPKYNEAKSRQKEAMNPIIREIEALPAILRAMGLDNVILIHASSEELAGNIIAEADKTQTRLSNVVILASKNTVNSGSFVALRSSPGEEKAFIAGVDPAELERISQEGGDSLSILNVKILEMLSIALDLAAGKEPPNIPMITSYEKSSRIVMLLPRAEPKDYEQMKRSYFAQQAALSAA